MQNEKCKVKNDNGEFRMTRDVDVRKLEVLSGMNEVGSEFISLRLSSLETEADL